MTFLEIEAFLNIVQYGSFSAAAEKLYITQPALGRRIRALEEELGYTLFVRNKGVRHVELTRQGQAFVGLAHRWQALWNETQEAALLGSEKSFYVASVGSLLAFMLPNVFQTFIRDNPECSLHVTTIHSADAYGYVSNKDVDIAFITDPMYSLQIKTNILFEEELCLVAGADLKLPKHVSLKDLDPRREIRTRWDRNFDTWHDYYFGTSAMPRIYLDEMGFLQYFTQSGENWAFLPVSIARTMVKNAPLSIHELDIKPPNRTVYYIYRLQDASPYQEELLKLYKQELRNVPGVVLKANDE
ncbi:MAG: LysR family transcriptional regulator [Lachnospiraceae bacterium]|nr:LysR family transcriptional regulator [Lachnospiraceae bacterium]